MYRRALKVQPQSARHLHARSITTFSYLVPGQLPPRRHTLAWRESERAEVWSTEGIPEDVSTQMANSVEGSPDSFFELCSKRVSAKLDGLRTTSGPLYLLHALKAVMDQRSVAALSDSEWAPLLKEPTPEEMLAVSTPEGLRGVVRSLQQKVEALQSDLGKRSLDAFDSGEVDLDLSMEKADREKLQISRHRDLLVSGAEVLRQLCLVATALHGAASPMHSSMMDDAVRKLQPLLHTPSNVYEVDRSLKGFNLDMAKDEIASFDQHETWDETVAQMLAHKEKFEFKLPRKILPSPLQANAPDAKMADVARVIDENPSLSQEDKEYILQHYADALAGDAEKALGDFAAEKKAFIDPQPLWGVYDPELVKKQDEAADAAKSQGKYSAEKGLAIDSDWIDPRMVGSPDLNPKREALSATEEVQRTLGQYDSDLSKDITSMSQAITEALAKSMGIRAPSSSSSAGGKAGGIHVAPGADKAEAAKAVKTFFQRYAAGERLPLPEPPKGGFRVVEASANPNAGKPKPADKGKKGGKK